MCKTNSIKKSKASFGVLCKMPLCQLNAKQVYKVSEIDKNMDVSVSSIVSYDLIYIIYVYQLTNSNYRFRTHKS